MPWSDVGCRGCGTLANRTRRPSAPTGPLRCSSVHPSTFALIGSGSLNRRFLLVEQCDTGLGDRAYGVPEFDAQFSIRRANIQKLNQSISECFRTDRQTWRRFHVGICFAKKTPPRETVSGVRLPSRSSYVFMADDSVRITQRRKPLFEFAHQGSQSYILLIGVIEDIPIGVYKLDPEGELVE